MGNKNSSRKRLKRYVKSYGTITMIEFLRTYVGISSQFRSLEKATHKDIKILHFDGVVTVPFDIVDKDDLASGNIIFVKDCMHNIGAYKNPLRLDENNKSNKSNIKVLKK